MRWKRMLVPAALGLLAACGDEGPAVVTQVTVTPAEADLFVAQQLQLQVTPEDQHGNRVEQTECTWSSAAPMVVEVDAAGVARGVSSGSAAVTATCEGVPGSAHLTVDPLILDDSTILEMSGARGYLYDVGGSSPTDVFAVGTTCASEGCGTIMHYDGARWSEMRIPGAHRVLLGVWANSASDVFTVGRGGTILHYDGTAWAPMESGTTADLAEVWGSSSTDVFAVGAGGTVLHYEGLSWSPMSVPPGDTYLTGIWGTSGTDVFTVGGDEWFGGGGTIMHYDGVSWVTIYDGDPFALSAVWGSAATDVFAVGEWGTVLHYDGTSWVRVSVHTTHNLLGIWGTADHHVFVAGAGDGHSADAALVLHYDGSFWGATEPDMPGLLGVWGTSDAVFLVGNGPTVLHVKR